MPIHENGPVRIHYEEAGSGFPLLVIPGGGLNATIAGLANHAFNPLEEFSDTYRVVALDLRNANGGLSEGPLEIDSTWNGFTDDQLALLDHLGIGRFMVMGYCIGGPMIWNLLRVRLEMNRVFSGSCETAREELDAGEEDPGLGGLDGRLEVLGQPPVSIEPGERALDDPSAGQELEARHARGTVDDLQRPAADPLQCALELGPGMGAVGEDVARAGKVAGDGGEHRRRAVAVLDVGAVDHDRDQQAAGVGEDVTLAALDFLSGVEAPDTAAFRGL